MTDQPEALILAETLEYAAGDYSWFDRYLGHESAAKLREQHAEIERLKAALQERGMAQPVERTDGQQTARSKV